MGILSWFHTSYSESLDKFNDFSYFSANETLRAVLLNSSTFHFEISRVAGYTWTCKGSEGLLRRLATSGSSMASAIFSFRRFFARKHFCLSTPRQGSRPGWKKLVFSESACLTISSMRYRGKVNKFTRTEVGKQTLDDILYLLSSTHNSARVKIKNKPNICRFVINESATRLFLEPAVLKKSFLFLRSDAWTACRISFCRANELSRISFSCRLLPRIGGFSYCSKFNQNKFSCFHFVGHKDKQRNCSWKVSYQLHVFVKLKSGVVR